MQEQEENKGSPSVVRPNMLRDDTVAPAGRDGPGQAASALTLNKTSEEINQLEVDKSPELVRECRSDSLPSRMPELHTGSDPPAVETGRVANAFCGNCVHTVLEVRGSWCIDCWVSHAQSLEQKLTAIGRIALPIAGHAFE